MTKVVWLPNETDYSYFAFVIVCGAKYSLLSVLKIQLQVLVCI